MHALVGVPHGLLQGRLSCTPEDHRDDKDSWLSQVVATDGRCAVLVFDWCWSLGLCSFVLHEGVHSAPGWELTEGGMDRPVFEGSSEPTSGGGHPHSQGAGIKG